MPEPQCEPTRDEVARALRALRPIERDILSLAARGRLTNEAIACRLGMPLRTVERHLARALRRLDRAIERQRERGGRT
ncbi:MAG: hypothetical protein B7Z08_01040 [Sphingomonadales bacterium 32-68-7]|nr:MAG: hypothetical protein B7Z33_03285 [Sphingomonadales bacterium 12-68-11]OYX10427.1 MAG: hypothetical protein B7Z08_01040 [Sphingomonadales bacterium 32-68-7]